MGTGGIYSQIYTSLASDQSIFPSLPETTIRLRSILNDSSCDIPAAAKVLQTDPGLSAFILRVANSAGYMSRVPPKGLESALRRIGLESASNLATTFAIQSSFRCSDRGVNRLLLAAYAESTQVAVISHFLATRVKGLDPGKVMLAGLLQDIGVPPILIRLRERKEIYEDPDRRRQVIDGLAPLVAVLILKNWGFDNDFVEVARNRNNWLRDSGESPDLGDIVLIARLHSLIGTPRFRECPSFQELPAFRKLPVGELTPDNSIRMLDEAREEIAALARMLRGE
ncbi:MAG: HDOD domain-containing protein [Sedimenticola sp.]|nr:HDOD domain-containing protein [Sedimenticola sp.]